MTAFEIIIFSIIYLFCYGFTMSMFMKEENVWLIFFYAIISFVLAFYAPLIIGGMLYEILNKYTTKSEDKE